MHDDRDLAHAMYRHGDDTVDTITDALRAAARASQTHATTLRRVEADGGYGALMDAAAAGALAASHERQRDVYDNLADDLAGGVAAIIDEGDDPDTYPVTVQVRRTLTTTHPYTPAGQVCDECGRAFDMQDEGDAGEWAYGHDCEVSA